MAGGAVAGTLGKGVALPMTAADGSELLRVLRGRLARDGLHIVLPIDQVGFDRACAEVGAPPMASLLEGGVGAVIIGDGGGRFFSRFQAGSAQQTLGRDPLDGHTRAVISRAVKDAFGEGGLDVRCRTLYPFTFEEEIAVLPFQRLGMAAGLPAPGPVGVQVHPTFGPWWAYRGLLIVSTPLQTEAPLGSVCSTCLRPCSSGCPGGAASAKGLEVERCISHRRFGDSCDQSCGARAACPVGVEYRYPAHQVAFHMRASLTHIRRSLLSLD